MGRRGTRGGGESNRKGGDGCREGRAGVAVSWLCDGMKSMKLLSVLPSLGLVSLSFGLVRCISICIWGPFVAFRPELLSPSVALKSMSLPITENYALLCQRPYVLSFIFGHPLYFFSLFTREKYLYLYGCVQFISLLIILLQVWSVARKYAFNPLKVRFQSTIDRVSPKRFLFS
jgi:hypothetical protein